MPKDDRTAQKPRYRILSSYENLAPNTGADADVVFHTAAALAALGHEVSLAVPEPQGMPATYAAETLAYYGITEPLRLIGLPTRHASLAMQHMQQAWRLTRHPAFAAADFIYARNPLVVWASLRAGQRVMMDHYRPWGDQFPPLQPMMRFFGSHPRFLGLVTHSHFAARSHLRLGMPSAKVRVVHNGYRPAAMLPVLTASQARQQLGLPSEQAIVTYAGRLSEKKGLDVLLAMAKRLPEVLFWLVGSTGDGPIERAAAGQSNVRFAPWQVGAALSPYLYASDVLILPPSLKPLRDVGNTVLPLKLFLYLAAGRAILAGRQPDTAELLQHDRNAWLLEVGDVERATTELRLLLADPARRQRLGDAAKQDAATLTWQQRGVRIDAFVHERLAIPPAPARLGPWSAARCWRDSGHWLARGLLTQRWINPGAADEA